MDTKIFRISENDTDIAEKLGYCADVIKCGGLVVFPTETVYGLGADATNPDASGRIFAAKGRPSDNPLIIHVATPKDAEEYVYTSELYYKLAERFMPGPLTVVLRSKDTVPLNTRGGLETVAVRCPENKIARKLIELSGTAIAAPSANLSGSPSPTTAEHVIDDMQGRVDVIIDGGPSDFGLESTIVKIEDDGTLTLLRPGKITPDDLQEIATVRIADAVTDMLKDGEKAISPGMKYRHYAPKSPLLLLDGEPSRAAEYINSDGCKNIAVISYEDDIDFLKEKIAHARFYVFGKREDEQKQAHVLFSILRDADKESYDKIYAPLPAKSGVGLALYNRMIRAAAHTVIKL